MANRNTVGFGLIPSGALGGTAAAGGQNKYKIDSGYGSSIYLGQDRQLVYLMVASTQMLLLINQRSLATFRELQPPLTAKTSMHLLSTIPFSNTTCN